MTVGAAIELACRRYHGLTSGPTIVGFRISIKVVSTEQNATQPPETALRLILVSYASYAQL